MVPPFVRARAAKGYERRNRDTGAGYAGRQRARCRIGGYHEDHDPLGRSTLHARPGNPLGRYQLLAAEVGIRAVLLKRRLDEALRLMLADNKDERSLTEVARRCGFGGTSQFSRAFRARFGAPPRQYRALVRQQDLEWHEARLVADGFEQDTFLWRQQGLNGSKQPGGSD